MDVLKKYCNEHLSRGMLSSRGRVGLTSSRNGGATPRMSFAFAVGLPSEQHQFEKSDNSRYATLREKRRSISKQVQLLGCTTGGGQPLVHDHTFNVTSAEPTVFDVNAEAARVAELRVKRKLRDAKAKADAENILLDALLDARREMSEALEKKQRQQRALERSNKRKSKQQSEIAWGVPVSLNSSVPLIPL